MKMLLTAALAVLLSLSVPAAMAGDFDDFFDANALFLQGQSAGKLPRKSDPAGAALLARLTNAGRLHSAAAAGDAQRAALSNMCSAIGSSAQAYMVENVSTLATEQDAALKRVFGNMREYQDELAMLLPYLVQCTGRLISFAEAASDRFTPSTLPSERMLGLLQMRLGVNQMLLGYVQEVTRDVFSEANRHQMSLALLETAPSLVGALTLADRARIRDMILAAPKQKSPQLADDLAKLADIMADQRCEKLCKF